MKCDECDGRCCVGFSLSFVSSGYKLYKNHYPPGTELRFGSGIIFIRQENLSWNCSAFKNGKCSDYDNRPNFCRRFLCESHEDYGSKEIDLISDERNVYKVYKL